MAHLRVGREGTQEDDGAHDRHQGIRVCGRLALQHHQEADQAAEHRADDPEHGLLQRCLKLRLHSKGLSVASSSGPHCVLPSCSCQSIWNDDRVQLRAHRCRLPV